MMSSSYAAPIEVAQAALHRVGEEAIADLNDGSSPSLIIASNYQGIVDGYLTMHAWTFATKTVDLALVGAATSAKWAFEHSIPSEVLNIRVITRAGIDMESGDWDLEDGVVLANTDEALQAIVTYRVGESKWPADFAECVVMRIKALFMEGLLDKWQEAKLVIDDIEGKPGRPGKLGQAMVRDKRQVPAKRVVRARLPNVWRGATSPARV